MRPPPRGCQKAAERPASVVDCSWQPHSDLAVRAYGRAGAVATSARGHARGRERGATRSRALCGCCGLADVIFVVLTRKLTHEESSTHTSVDIRATSGAPLN